jgi:hypothetical protein
MLDEYRRFSVVQCLLKWVNVTQFVIEEDTHMLGTVIVVILILMLLGALPAYPYSANWGYFPSGILGTVLLVWLLLVLVGRV